MALVGAIIGLPMFFEIGLVMLMPVIYLVARRAQVSLITVGIPALAGLSAMHGFVPPHPGPVTAIGYLGANLGLTLALGILVAVPTIIVSGPLFGRLAGRWVDIPAPATYDQDVLGARRPPRGPRCDHRCAGRPRPVLRRDHVHRAAPGRTDARQGAGRHARRRRQRPARRVFDVIGEPIFALLIAVIVAMFTLGRASGMDQRAASRPR